MLILIDGIDERLQVVLDALEGCDLDVVPHAKSDKLQDLFDVVAVELANPSEAVMVNRERPIYENTRWFGNVQIFDRKVLVTEELNVHRCFRRQLQSVGRARDADVQVFFADLQHALHNALLPVFFGFGVALLLLFQRLHLFSLFELALQTDFLRVLNPIFHVTAILVLLCRFCPFFLRNLRWNCMIIGNMASEHAGKTVRLVISSLVFLPLLLFAALMLTAPIWAWFFMRENYSWPIFIWVPIGALIGYGSYGLIAENIRNIGRRVLVTAEGIQDTRKGETRTLRWDEVDKVWQKMRRSKMGHLSQEFTLQAGSSTPFVFSHRLTDIDQLRDAILQETYARLFPKITQHVDRGLEVDFGMVKVGQQGIAQGKSLVPWNQIKTAGVNPMGSFMVIEKGKMLATVNFPAELAFNLHVLRGLIDARTTSEIG